MSDLEAVMTRLTNDPGFADAIRAHPAHALRSYRLDATDLARLERVLGVGPSAAPLLFGPSG